MSWSTEHWNKGEDRLSFLSQITQMEKIIEFLDDQFGNIGKELPLSERVVLIIGRLQEEIEDLYHANARGEYDEEWLDRCGH